MKIIFWHGGEIFEFPYFLFCLKIFFNVNGKGHNVTQPLLLITIIFLEWVFITQLPILVGLVGVC